MPTSADTKLAAPGAGLPFPELLIARSRFTLKCWTGDRDSFVANFQEERDKIGDLIASIPESQRGEQRLIKRLRGMEDSSRDWSVWMTLDHLRITNSAFAHSILLLSKGKTPNVIASTAAVKPDPAVTVRIEDKFQKSCDAFLKLVEKAGDLKTEVRHTHPWFGPLDAFRWLALASMHMGIHRAQIAAIIDARPSLKGYPIPR